MIRLPTTITISQSILYLLQLFHTMLLSRESSGDILAPPLQCQIGKARARLSNAWLSGPLGYELILSKTKSSPFQASEELLRLTPYPRRTCSEPLSSLSFCHGAILPPPLRAERSPRTKRPDETRAFTAGKGFSSCLAPILPRQFWVVRAMKADGRPSID